MAEAASAYQQQQQVHPQYAGWPQPAATPGGAAPPAPAWGTASMMMTPQAGYGYPAAAAPVPTPYAQPPYFGVPPATAYASPAAPYAAAPATAGASPYAASPSPYATAPATAGGYWQPYAGPRGFPPRRFGGPGPMYGREGFGRRSHPYMGPPSTTLKLLPLPAGTTEAELTSTFSVFGPVDNVVIHQTYAYINFSTVEAAQAAQLQRVFTIAGQTVEARRAPQKTRPVEEGPPSDGIGMFNLTQDTTVDQLKELLKPYPGLKDVRMVMDKDTRCFKGYAFAYFESIEAATAAKMGLQGSQIGENPIDIKYAKKTSSSMPPASPQALGPPPSIHPALAQGPYHHLNPNAQAMGQQPGFSPQPAPPPTAAHFAVQQQPAAPPAHPVATAAQHNGVAPV